MLYRLEIENFSSIRGPQVIDLIAAKSAEADSERLVPIGPGLEERAPRVIGIFGPNASGKSTVLRALSFLSWFIRFSFQWQPDNFLPFFRFQDDETLDGPMRLSAWFTEAADPTQAGEVHTQACKYAYEVVIGGNRTRPQEVQSETLRYWPIETNRPVLLFSRTEKGVTANKAFGLAGYHTPLEKVLRPGASVISTLTQLKHPIAARLWQKAALISSNILVEKQEPKDEDIARMYHNAPNLLSALNREIERIDFGINELTFVQGPNGPHAVFRHDGLSGVLTLPLESHGTRQFIKMFPLIFDALARGGIAVIDELDLSIHPLILPEILRWFNDSKRNPLDAQLWMTGQNASVLENLIKEEIFFCEKDRGGRTKVYGLRDIKSVRRAENYYRKYLSGIYGAVPRLG
jgi:uncharacterized protein